MRRKNSISKLLRIGFIASTVLLIVAGIIFWKGYLVTTEGRKTQCTGEPGYMKDGIVYEASIHLITCGGDRNKKIESGENIQIASLAVAAIGIALGIGTGVRAQMEVIKRNAKKGK